MNSIVRSKGREAPRWLSRVPISLEMPHMHSAIMLLHGNGQNSLNISLGSVSFRLDLEFLYLWKMLSGNFAKPPGDFCPSSAAARQMGTSGDAYYTNQLLPETAACIAQTMLMHTPVPKLPAQHGTARPRKGTPLNKLGNTTRSPPGARSVPHV